ncbi:hypothetical protein NP493_870g02075 [Ridgeia piscesae]|uniref:NR LBD domain-containing protein n=1 Tax=Ridgeia piscesae TaxID=27915 RepID=A0AAD9KLG1_RIDPI|nr:hypothetical protein NP493_870g02075 [Ridgeia piscesae]
MSHNAFNHQHGLFTFFWGETMDVEKLSTLHSMEFIEALLTVSAHIQKLELSQTETIILSCIPLFFTDRCKLKCPEKAEEGQRLMLETFSYLLGKMHPEDPMRLAQCLLLFPELRSCSILFSKEEENFTVTWNDKVNFPPLLYELWSP